LMSAAHAGQREAVRYLIAEGSDIDALDDRGNSPLLIAVMLRHSGVVEELIAAGADVHVKNQDNITPWKAASDNQDTKILELLKKAGAKF
jgi:ankyrin repeat protein